MDEVRFRSRPQASKHKYSSTWYLYLVHRTCRKSHGWPGKASECPSVLSSLPLFTEFSVLPWYFFLIEHVSAEPAARATICVMLLLCSANMEVLLLPGELLYLSYWDMCHGPGMYRYRNNQKHHHLFR